MSKLTDIFFSKIDTSISSSNIPCGRYAPSPTGSLHAGNLRTALIAWLQARLAQGRFIVRIEDIDLPRRRPGSAQQILHDLKWLGLDWDEGPDCSGPHGPYTQSERFDLYQCAVDVLIQKHLLYACNCTRKDIIQAASAPHTSDQRRIYPGTCRSRSLDNQYQTGVNQTSLRFHCPERTIEFNDHIRGRHRYKLDRDIGDFVIKRTDGLFSYHLAVTLDDALMGVTHVVRGADLIDSTAQQILLLETFGFPTPHYWHIPLVIDDNSGKRLSKREGSLSIQYFRDQGMDGPGLVGQFAASLDLVPKRSRLSTQELLQEITPQRLIVCLKQHSLLN